MTFTQFEENARAIPWRIWPFEIVARVVSKIALLQGNNDYYANLIPGALYPFVLNETNVNDLLCAVLSRMAHNEQSAGLCT